MSTLNVHGKHSNGIKRNPGKYKGKHRDEQAERIVDRIREAQDGGSALTEYDFEDRDIAEFL